MPVMKAWVVQQRVETRVSGLECHVTGELRSGCGKLPTSKQRSTGRPYASNHHHVQKI